MLTTQPGRASCLGWLCCSPATRLPSTASLRISGFSSPLTAACPAALERKPCTREAHPCSVLHPLLGLGNCCKMGAAGARPCPRPRFPPSHPTFRDQVAVSEMGAGAPRLTPPRPCPAPLPGEHWAGQGNVEQGEAEGLLSPAGGRCQLRVDPGQCR